MELKDIINDYYDKRGLKYPDIWEALAFAQTEQSEVYELLFSRKGGFVRNNPENKPKFSEKELATELGDAIMMLLVAGYVEGVDPIDALVGKLTHKLAVLEEKRIMEEMGYETK